MSVKICLYHMSNKLDEYELSEFPLVIGRSPTADITIEDCWVSRRHCEIQEHGGVLTVRDLGSRHGTRLNSDRIAEATLTPGDRLNVGLSTLIAEFVDLPTGMEAAAG